MARERHGNCRGSRKVEDYLEVRDDVVTGISGINHDLKVVRIGEEDLIYVDKPVASEIDALRILMLHIDTGMKLYIDAPIDKRLYDMLSRAKAIYMRNDRDSSDGG